MMNDEMNFRVAPFDIEKQEEFTRCIFLTVAFALPNKIWDDDGAHTKYSSVTLDYMFGATYKRTNRMFFVNFISFVWNGEKILMENQYCID